MDWYSKESYCKDLPTLPVPEIGIVLVPELLERGYRVRVMVRKYSDEYVDRWPDALTTLRRSENV